MASGTELQPLNLLVIDDDEFMLEVVTMTLARFSGTTVSACTDGAQALARIDSGDQFDVVMVDLNMPVMDGVEVLRNLAVREFVGGILLFSGEDAPDSENR